MAGQSENKVGEMALKRCEDLIDSYERQKGIQKTLDSVLQTSVIVAAGLTAFAATVDSWPKWAVVLPAILTTVVTGLSTNFRFRAKHSNFASAVERLKWLKLRYQIRSENAPGNPKHLEDFVTSIEAIVASELADWREGPPKEDSAANKATPPEKAQEKGASGTEQTPSNKAKDAAAKPPAEKAAKAA